MILYRGQDRAGIQLRAESEGSVSLGGKRLRIVFFIDFIETLAGGTENQLVKLLRGLDKTRHEVWLFTLRDSEWIQKNAQSLGCPVEIFDMQKLGSFQTLVSAGRVLARLRRIKPDVVITFFPLSNIVGVLLARLARARSVVSTRRDYGLWLDWHGRLGLFMLRWANRFVDAVVVNAESVKDITSTKEGVALSRIRVIHNGIDPASFCSDSRVAADLRSKMRIPAGHFVVGIVGGLKPMKRHDMFVRAAARILEKRRDVVFVLVGDGPTRAELVRLSSELGVLNSLRFAGSQSDVVPYLSLFDIGVNCSTNEGMSNAVMEYLASGVPCVVSRLGGNPDLIEQGVNGLLFEQGDEDQLAASILNLLEDNDLRAKLAMEGRRLVYERLDLTKMVAAYERLFSEVCAGRPPVEAVRREVAGETAQRGVTPPLKPEA